MTGADVMGLWALCVIVVGAILWGTYTAAAWRRVSTDIRWLRMLDSATATAIKSGGLDCGISVATEITELDVEDPVVAELDEYPSLLYGDAWDAACDAWEYQVEVNECCGGRDLSCGHAR